MACDKIILHIYGRIPVFAHEGVKESSRRINKALFIFAYASWFSAWLYAVSKILSLIHKFFARSLNFLKIAFSID